MHMESAHGLKIDACFVAVLVIIEDKPINSNESRMCGQQYFFHMVCLVIGQI